MDDIVVIILTLIIVVIGAVNQFRKKQVPPTTEGQENDVPPKKNFWEELLDSEEFRPGNEPETEPANWEPYYEEPENKMEPTNTKSEPILTNPKNEGVHSIKKERLNTIKNSEIGSEKKQINLPTGFTLKRAIIFSEIIQRKYF